MKFFAREALPQTLTIDGRDYPAIYTFKAVYLLEDYTELKHVFTEVRLAEEPESLTPREVVGLIGAVLKAAGVEVEFDDLEKQLRPGDFKKLAPQLQKIVSDQSGTGEDDADVEDAEKN